MIEIWGLKRAAVVLGLSARGTRLLVQRGDLKAVLVGHSWVVLPTDVTELLARRGCLGRRPEKRRQAAA